MLNYLTLRFAADEPDVPYLNSMVFFRAAAARENPVLPAGNLNAHGRQAGRDAGAVDAARTARGAALAKWPDTSPGLSSASRRAGRRGVHPAALRPFARRIHAPARFADAPARRPRRQAGLLESSLTLDSARKKLIPTMLPVHGGWYSSNYGWRIDPFSGQRAFHEGIDVIAEQGTAVHAAAGGVVVYSELHPQYGNMIEIDHGNDLITRYAHASKRLVKVGDVVLRGGKVAEVGRTGRATGTHLQFEVRQRGAPVNPAQFLRYPADRERKFRGGWAGFPTPFWFRTP